MSALGPVTCRGPDCMAQTGPFPTCGFKMPPAWYTSSSCRHHERELSSSRWDQGWDERLSPWVQVDPGCHSSQEQLKAQDPGQAAPQAPRITRRSWNKLPPASLRLDRPDMVAILLSPFHRLNSFGSGGEGASHWACPDRGWWDLLAKYSCRPWDTGIPIPEPPWVLQWERGEEPILTLGSLWTEKKMPPVQLIVLLFHFSSFSAQRTFSASLSLHVPFKSTSCQIPGTPPPKHVRGRKEHDSCSKDRQTEAGGQLSQGEKPLRAPQQALQMAPALATWSQEMSRGQTRICLVVGSWAWPDPRAWAN